MAEEKRVDKWLEHVRKLLHEWKRDFLVAPPPTGFGISQIRRAVRIMVERVEDPEELDWSTMWGRLTREDYDHIDDFIVDLEKSKLLPPPPVEEVEDETPASLEKLLEKLGLELPSYDDPYYQIRLEEVAGNLAKELIEAEKHAGKVKVKVRDKRGRLLTRLWNSKKVYEFVDALNLKIRLLENELRKAEEEKAKLRKEVKARPLVKVRVLKDFSEAWVRYKKDQVLQFKTPEEIEWAKKKILEGYLEEVPLIEKKPPVTVPAPPPVKIIPPTALPEEVFKPKVKWTKKFERKLRDVFETTLHAGLPEEGIAGLSPYRFLPEFRRELEGTKMLETEEKMVDHIADLAKDILRREAKPVKPPPTLPPGWEKVKGGYLVNGRFISEEEFPRERERLRFPPTPTVRPARPREIVLKPPAIGPHEWIKYVKKIDDVTWFKKMTEEERKKILDEYVRLCEEYERGEV